MKDSDHKRKRLFITGASGFLGRHVCLEAAGEATVFGTYLSRRASFENINTFCLDLTRFADVKETLQNIKPESVIHTAAAADPNMCQNSPAAAFRINVTAAANLAGLCADYGIRFVFTSSDLVFDGRSRFYRETDPTNPINVYGEQKAAAERKIRARNPMATICRMALMFGSVSSGRSTFFATMIDSLRQGKAVKLFTDEFRTILGAKSAAAGLLFALDHPSEILHLAGAKRLSRYAFGLCAARILDLPPHLLIPCRVRDVAASAPRPADVSLDISKIRNLGFEPLSISAELKHFEAALAVRSPSNKISSNMEM